MGLGSGAALLPAVRMLSASPLARLAQLLMERAGYDALGCRGLGLGLRRPGLGRLGVL